jgi:hypothetical protein
MSLGLESTDFEWLDPEQHMSQLSQENVASTDIIVGLGAPTATADSTFLKEGYLHVMEGVLPRSEEQAPPTPLARMALKFVRKASDPSIVVSSSLT